LEFADGCRASRLLVTYEVKRPAIHCDANRLGFRRRHSHSGPAGCRPAADAPWWCSRRRRRRGETVACCRWSWRCLQPQTKKRTVERSSTEAPRAVAYCHGAEGKPRRAPGWGAEARTRRSGDDRFVRYPEHFDACVCVSVEGGRH
jgi:hypothetical protein